jgi:hypothetical protein
MGINAGGKRNQQQSIGHLNQNNASAQTACMRSTTLQQLLGMAWHENNISGASIN